MICGCLYKDFGFRLVKSYMVTTRARNENVIMINDGLPRSLMTYYRPFFFIQKLLF